MGWIDNIKIIEKEIQPLVVGISGGIGYSLIEVNKRVGLAIILGIAVFFVAFHLIIHFMGKSE